MDLGFGEIVVILIVVLLFFGPSKLPQLGEALGRGIRNFKKGFGDSDDDSAAADTRAGGAPQLPAHAPPPHSAAPAEKAPASAPAEVRAK